MLSHLFDFRRKTLSISLVLVSVMVSCKKDSAPAPPPPPPPPPPVKVDVSLTSFQLASHAKFFIEPFVGKQSESIDVVLIPQADKPAELGFTATTEPASFANKLSFMIEDDAGSPADSSRFKITGSKIGFLKPGTYRIKGRILADSTNNASAIFGEVRIQIASNIPDNNFRQVLKQIPALLFKDDVLDTATAIHPNVPSAFGLESNHIKNLEGIRYFQNLEKLLGTFNDIEAVDLSSLQKLTQVHLGSNQLSEIDVSGNANLEFLDVSENNSFNLVKIANLHKLTELEIGGTNVSSLDLSGLENLEVFNCVNTPLSNVDLSQCPNLATFLGISSQITTLDIRHLAQLKLVRVYNTPLTHIIIDPAADSNPNLAELEIPDAIKCSDDLKAIKSYRGAAVVINAYNGSQVTVLEHDPLLYCP